MRAIVLVGGEGTRLRPLTLRTLKQQVPILNRPLLEHLLLHLRSAGVTDVTLAMTRHSEPVSEAFGDGAAVGMRLDYVYEETPLGSGGAIASVAAGWDEPFLVFNGDLLMDLDLIGFAAAHHSRGADLSIALYEVEDPSPFGVVVLGEHGRIERFVEKPPRETAPSRLINAGAWLFQPSVLSGMDGTQFNRVEDGLFPDMADSGRGLYGFVHEGFWMDVGNPDAYLQANMQLLAGAVPARLPEGWPSDGMGTAGAFIEAGASVEGPVLLGTATTVAPGAMLSSGVVAGHGCLIGPSSRVRGSVLWDDVVVEEEATVADSVVASGARIGAGATVQGAVLGHGVTVAAGTHVPPGTRLTPDTIWTERA